MRRGFFAFGDPFAEYAHRVVTGVDTEEWLERVIAIDPLLRDPLELYATRARRRTIADALLRQLGFENRVFERRITEPTYRVVIEMLDELATIRTKPRVLVRSVANDVARRGTANPALVLQAMFDLGWSHEEFNLRGTLRDDVLPAVTQRYVDLMTGRVLKMLRLWEHGDWIHDKE